MNSLLATIRGQLFRLRLKYTRTNVSIGEGLKLFCRMEIRGSGRVSVGRDCVVSGIRGNRLQYVTIYTHSPDAVVSIGDRATLYAARISSKFEIAIGDNVLIEESGVMDTDFHSITSDRGEPVESREKCRVRVGDRVSIGARSLVCKGVTIDNDVLVFPGSVVNRSVQAGSVVAGNPVKPFRKSAAVPQGAAV